MFSHIFKKYKLLILPSALYSLCWITHLSKEDSLNSCVGQGPSLPAATGTEQMLDTSLAWGKAAVELSPAHQASPAHCSFAIHFTASLPGIATGKQIIECFLKKLSVRGLGKRLLGQPLTADILMSSHHCLTLQHTGLPRDISQSTVLLPGTASPLWQVRKGFGKRMPKPSLVAPHNVLLNVISLMEDGEIYKGKVKN